jgi:hypothetical protein
MPIQMPVHMKDKPKWLAWSYTRARLPKKLFNDLDAWRKLSGWFLSAPHLRDDREALQNHATAELWALGMGMILQELIYIYMDRHNDGASASIPFQILQHWIRDCDRSAKVLIVRTMDLLRSEFLHEQGDAGSREYPDTPPNPSVDRRHRHTPVRAEPIGTQYKSASAGPASVGVVNKLITRSMTRQANDHSSHKLKGGKKRQRESDDDLPTIAERTSSAPKRKRR